MHSIVLINDRNIPDDFVALYIQRKELNVETLMPCEWRNVYKISNETILSEIGNVSLNRHRVT